MVLTMLDSCLSEANVTVDLSNARADTASGLLLGSLQWVKCGHVRHIRGMPLHCSVADELAQRSIELVRCWRKACIRAYQMNLMAANGTAWACAQRSLTPRLARNSRASLRAGHTPA